MWTCQEQNVNFKWILLGQFPIHFSLYFRSVCGCSSVCPPSDSQIRWSLLKIVIKNEWDFDRPWGEKGRKWTCGFQVIRHRLPCRNGLLPRKTRVVKQPQKLHRLVVNHIHTSPTALKEVPACSGAYSWFLSTPAGLSWAHNLDFVLSLMSQMRLLLHKTFHSDIIEISSLRVNLWLN